RATILLAEDEESVRRYAASVLQQQGYVVLEAPDGEAALRVAADHAGRIDLLVSDVVMPRFGGRALAERLREARPALRVLFLSGYTDDAVMRHGIHTHEVAFLAKPFTPAALLDKVRAVLSAGSKSPSPLGGEGLG